ncbi:MAG: hypothetical protein WBD40_23905 [Tepidisphaeraceae bacterium]
MRRLLAGLLILFLSSTGFAQVRAEVESIGFNNHYRPDCWTPMVVRITPEKSGTYQLHVIQEDIDADQPTFTQEITLTGADEGATASEQRFWMYFIPQPTHKGLYDVSRMGTVAELDKQIQVYLCDAKGKQIKKLPITSSIINLEPADSNPFAISRGTKLVLTIGDGTSKIIPGEYDKALGVLETAQFVALQSKDLPESPRGYEAVDAIVWTNTNAPSASSPTEERRLRAIQEWVRRGGRLVICQPPERDRTLPWGDMLPVIVNEIGEKTTLDPLVTLTTPSKDTDPMAKTIARVWNPPLGPRGPFRIARAEAKPGTIVDTWIEWDAAGKDRTPYIARMGYGLGSVTWVAQDLGDQAITNRATLGWTNVWNRVLGWNDSSFIKTPTSREEESREWEGNAAVDLYPSMMKGAELGAKSRAFVGLAIVFFVVYWLVAGPGLYLYLVAKARAYMSWFVFGASAIAATAVTVLVVQLVVRGDPELAHVSVVRKAAGEPAVVVSRFGLYIPRDGGQEVQLRDTDPSGDSYVTALAEHPKYVPENSEFPAFMNYTVPVHQPGSGEPVRVAFPYRSTLRKLQARWVGVMNGAVEGSGKIVRPSEGYIQGTLTNGTGRKLRNVYIAFNHPNYQGSNDVIMYLPEWDAGVSIDLAQEYRTASAKTVAPRRDINESTRLSGLPERNEKVIGTLAKDNTGWPAYWYEDLRPKGVVSQQESFDDTGRPVKKAFPMLSFFSRLPPMKSAQNEQRVEILRRGQRMLDVGHALAAGQLVVLAEAPNSPIPIPLDVEGDKITGNGTTFYQFTLPLDRTGPAKEQEDEPPAPAPGAVEKT